MSDSGGKNNNTRIYYSYMIAWMRPRRQVFPVTLITCLLALSSLVFFQVSKHYPALAAVNVFSEDPYDAVSSFGVQLAVLAGLVALIRIIRPYPGGTSQTRLLRILRGNAAALAAVSVSLFSDLVALVWYAPVWSGSNVGWFLALTTAGFLLLTILTGAFVYQAGKTLWPNPELRAWKTAAISLPAAAILALYPDSWRQGLSGSILAALVGMAFLFVLAAQVAHLLVPPPTGSSEDLLDDMVELYHWFKSRFVFASSLLGRVEAMAHISIVHNVTRWLDPRRYPWRLVLLAASVMGITLFLSEFLIEGTPPPAIFLVVMAVFIGLEGAGVFFGYLLFNPYLSLFHSA